MNIREVTEHITNSFLHISSSKVPSVTSLPRIINLLNKTKSEKAKAVEQAFFDFMKGENIVVLLSVSISSQLFKYIISKVPQIWFIEGRVSIDQNKRKDVLALLFTHQKVTI
ncbi:MAG: hypothetical protein IJ853_03280 [Rickettsiales bacterium]|nr:hypothetical protein [Rickettsiales bacterium]